MKLTKGISDLKAGKFVWQTRLPSVNRSENA